MHKVIVVLCAFLAVAYAEDHVDNYIKINRDQYHRVMDDYDAKLAYFGHHYKGRLQAVDIQKEMVVASIVHTEERLTPLVLLNGFAKQCVAKYRNRVASVEVTKESIRKCELIAINYLSTLLNAAIKVRNELESHIKNVFESEVVKCGKGSPDHYSSCISAVVSKSNKFTYENQKSFEYELEAAECVAKAKVKKYVDCTYYVYFDVLSKLGQVEVLVNRCLDGKDECKPCEEYTCSEAVNVYGHYHNETIANPLYGRIDSPKCLMLNVH